jgi:hypothetical protein
MRIRNPFRSEAEMYRFLWIVVGGAVVIVVAALINKWAGVAVAVLFFAALTWWLTHDALPGVSKDPPKQVVSATPEGQHRVLVVATPGTESVSVPDGTEVLVVVPALASKLEAATGAVDDNRAAAEATANALGEQLGGRGEVGADDPGLAAEDALRVFGADEVIVAGDSDMVDAIRERVAIPVSRAS